MNLLDEYEKRLKDMPQVDKNLQKQLRELQHNVQQQETQKQLNNVTIEALKTQLAKMANKVDEKDNQIQGLTQNQQKSMAKEKKYMTQVQNLTKKIQLTKQQIQTKTKQTQQYKKQIRALQGQVSMMNADKAKVLQTLTKKQIKYNNLVQTSTSLKLKKLQPVTKGIAPKAEDNKRQQKQILQLFGSIKKQMQLVDILKRQKTHLIASTVFKYCESDFSKLLQLNNKK